MNELSKEIYQEFYKKLLDNYIVEQNKSLAEKDEKHFVFKLKTGVQIAIREEETEVTWPDQTSYKGALLNNRFCPHLISLLTFDIVGSLFRNKIHGRGVLHSNNSKYEGIFMDGLYHGDGTFTNPDHSLVFEGQFMNGVPHGKGTLRIGDSDVFKGEFWQGKKVSGIHIYQNGIFVGQFDEHQFLKYGKYYFKESKAVYTGPFYQGFPHGIGQLDWNGSVRKDTGGLATVIPEIFKGCWENGKKHGLGILLWNKMSLMTIWKNGLKHGPALLIARNGDIFVSCQMFKDDQFLNAKKLYLNQDKIVLIQRIFNTKHFDINRFNFTLQKLIKDSKEIPDVSPFHLPDHLIELNITPIYNFITNILSSKGLQSSPEQEHKSLNQVIVDQYFNLCDIYSTYASFGASNKNYVMNRLGFWQFLRDLEFESTDINISDIITAAEIEFQIVVSNQNDFREPVYFCNFLKYLLYLTMLVNEGEKSQNCAVDVKLPYFGYFGTMFVIFLRNVLLRASPFRNGTITKKILGHDGNLMNILSLCSRLTEKMTIRTAFQCFCVLKGDESISMINNLWNPEYSTPELLKSVSFDDFYQCTRIIFPKMIQSQVLNPSSSETEPMITNSTFNITPLEFYELFEEVVILALKKRKVEALKNTKN